jgi:hypothetical protein
MMEEYCISYDEAALNKFVSAEFMLELEELGVDITDTEYLLCENTKQKRFICNKHEAIKLNMLYGGITPLISIYTHEELFKHFNKSTESPIKEQYEYIKKIFKHHVL